MNNFFLRTWFLYIVAGIFLFLFCNFNLARSQRMRELDSYKYFLTNCLNGCKDPGKVRLPLRYFTLLGQIDPAMARADEMRGICYLLLSDNQRAINAFNRVLARRPHFFWVEFDKGLALYHLQRFDEALAMFKDIAQRSNDDLLSSGILKSILFLPPEMRMPLIKILQEFILKIKTEDYQMILHCLAKDSLVKQRFVETHPWNFYDPSVWQPFKD